MKLTSKAIQNKSYLASLVEEGISILKQGSLKANCGGRKPLYFNVNRQGNRILLISMKRTASVLIAIHSTKKLYARYSAVAVKSGCT